VPFKVTFQPFQFSDDHAPTPAAAAERAVTDVAHLPHELWATVEPCDEDGWAIGPPLDVRIARDRGSAVATVEEPS